MCSVHPDQHLEMSAPTSPSMVTLRKQSGFSHS